MITYISFKHSSRTFLHIHSSAGGPIRRSRGGVFIKGVNDWGTRLFDYDDEDFTFLLADEESERNRKRKGRQWIVCSDREKVNEEESVAIYIHLSTYPNRILASYLNRLSSVHCITQLSPILNFHIHLTPRDHGLKTFPDNRLRSHIHKHIRITIPPSTSLHANSV